MKLFFSVVITVYNKAHFVAQTLQSILDQDFLEFEIIVVDDGSTDDSLDVISQFTDSRITLIANKNQGVSAARNCGMHVAKANYVALSDGDDLWLSSHLSELKALIDRFSNCGIYATSYQKKFFNNYITAPKFNTLNLPFFGIVQDYFRTSLVDNILWTSAVAIPKTIIEKGYVFDTALGCGEDIDLWITIAKDFDVAFSSRVTAYKMIHASDNHLSLTKNIPDLIQMIAKHKLDEASRHSLKMYLDQNRYAAALEAKILGDFGNYKKLKKDIDFKTLNPKLKLLLILPKTLLIALKKLKFWLLKKQLYKSPYR